MSIPVPLDALRAAIAERGGSAYLLTVAENSRPHAVHTRSVGKATRMVARSRKAHRRQRRRATGRLATLSVRTDGDYSLIVDGTAVVASNADAPRLLITPTKAVLHRPATLLRSRRRAVPDPASACGADCVPLLPKAGARR